MKIRLITLLLLFFVIAQGQSEKKIVILHTNDLHSRLNGFAPEFLYTPLKPNDDKTLGGFARIGCIIESEKKKNQGITLVCDAGDFLMGTLFHTLEASTGFQLRLMQQMGYDVVSIGNHEFDFGPEKLAAIVSQSKKNGKIPPLILGNAVFSSKDPGDDDLEALYKDKVISRKLIIERDSLKIGLFSVMGRDASEVAPLSRPVSFSKVVSFAKEMVRELKAEDCDMIICMSHSGIEKGKDGAWGGEDVELARKVRGIDLIISGHTHTELEEPLIVEGVPVIQTGEYGKNVGRIEMTWSPSGIRVNNYRLIAVNDELEGNRQIQDLILRQQDIITRDLLKPLDLEYFKPLAENDFLLESNEYGDFRESNLGPLIADAIHYYINRNTPEGTDISMVALGVIRDKIVPGVQTPADIFRVMSLGAGNDNIPGYPLARLYVTGREMKNILEILQVAYKSSPSNFCYYSGIRVQFDPGRGLMKKIQRIQIVEHDGSLSDVDFSKKNRQLYSVTANLYMLEFFGIIKKMSFGLINVVPKDAAGSRISDMSTSVIDMNKNRAGVQEGKEWLALMEYLCSMKDTNGNGIPEIDRRYLTPVKSFFESAE
ncbi:MAG: bifunctional metallophosphatase/5'-nucleotidase [Bacteroidales bacterium]|nr:bifunctional metallophosphatase/5'-nucleotidase [Bacteroidales bacterium]